MREEEADTQIIIKRALRKPRWYAQEIRTLGVPVLKLV